MPGKVLDNTLIVRNIGYHNASFPYSIVICFAKSKDAEIANTPEIDSLFKRLAGYVNANTGVNYHQYNTGAYEHCIAFISKTKEELKALAARMFESHEKLDTGKIEMLERISALRTNEVSKK